MGYRAIALVGLLLSPTLATAQSDIRIPVLSIKSDGTEINVSASRLFGPRISVSDGTNELVFHIDSRALRLWVDSLRAIIGFDPTLADMAMTYDYFAPTLFGDDGTRINLTREVGWQRDVYAINIQNDSMNALTHERRGRSSTSAMPLQLRPTVVRIRINATPVVARKLHGALETALSKVQLLLQVPPASP